MGFLGGHAQSTIPIAVRCAVEYFADILVAVVFIANVVAGAVVAATSNFACRIVRSIRIAAYAVSVETSVSSIGCGGMWLIVVQYNRFN